MQKEKIVKNLVKSVLGVVFVLFVVFAFMSCEGPQGLPGTNGVDGADGINAISVYWGELAKPPAEASIGDIYKDTDDGWVYILTTDGWAQFVKDGADGVDGEDGTRLLTTLQANDFYTPFAGEYHYSVHNYTPEVNARAFIYARMSADSNQAGDNFTFRIAYRTPADTGTDQIGDNFYLDTETTAANQPVFQANYDHIDLIADQSYDFGVHFFEAAAITGTNIDYLSMEVLVFER